MTSQLSLPDMGLEPQQSSVPEHRHINHDINEGSGLQAVVAVPGLQFVPGFLTPEQEADCVSYIDAADGEWRTDLSRRVQHYGWRYDYKARAITPDMHIGALPGWLAAIAERLCDETRLFDRVPEQVIVNEYEPGQGIATHIDHPGFGPTVCTISLLDDWEMDFSENWKDRVPALLHRRSCVLLTGDSRSIWQHGIAPRQREYGASGRLERRRGRRLSLTFRTVLNHDGVNDG